MARGRMINQTIDYDPEFNALSIEAQMLYLRALAFLDRDGLIIGNPRGLLNRVAPLMDHLQPHVPDIIDEWVIQGLVIRYAVKIGDILFFKGFGKNQSGMHYDRETPSRFEAPPGWTYGTKGLVPIESEPSPAQPESNPQTESGITPAEVRQESGGTPATVVNESAPIEVEVKDQDQLKPIEDDEDDTPARDPVYAAWFETYQDEMPSKLEKRVIDLVTECGEPAVVHGIYASVNAESRSFKFIAECARNYIPPPPESTAYVNGYQVDLPGVHMLQPTERVIAPPPLPPPMPHDDPWAIALAELLPTLPGQAGLWLEHSELSIGEIAGEPLYEILVRHPQANVEWLQRQTERAIRQKLGTIIGKRVNVGFVLADPVTP